MSRWLLGNTHHEGLGVLGRSALVVFDGVQAKQGDTKARFTQLQALDRGNPTCCLSAHNIDGYYNGAVMAMVEILRCG